MNILEIVLSPVIWLMEWVLDLYVSLFSSTGVAILLMSFTFSLLLIPVQKMANRAEQRIGSKMQRVDADVSALSGDLKGEERFLEIERIYEKHSYHPIHSVGMGASFFAMLPVLVSAIFLFTGSDLLVEKGFLFIDDLSKPDRLLNTMNLLPLLMFSITLVDAKLRFRDDRKSQLRFLIISIVLLVIVYDLAAGLVLYWTGSNLMSLTLNRLKAT